MAANRSRAESFTLDFPNAPMDVVPSAVLSPITELSMNLEHNSIRFGNNFPLFEVTVSWDCLWCCFPACKTRAKTTPNILVTDDNKLFFSIAWPELRKGSCLYVLLGPQTRQIRHHCFNERCPTNLVWNQPCIHVLVCLEKTNLIWFLCSVFVDILSGYFPSSPVGPAFDSPTLELLK